ncbi:hypothetical protein OCU04_005884 [Sclerotinia nivalis]|uniref:Uncharacterized protein n=1 Tax=Sclerotinia nivalis TaxID=352851 RepID=A0A9X0ALV2_9HELO|nr:hypothetical protein OCU04_005884 [Sclerotinia nivalis]
MAPRTVFMAPGNMILFSEVEHEKYMYMYNWVMAMQPFKEERTWAQVRAVYYTDFPLASTDKGKRYAEDNGAGLCDHLCIRRKALSQMEETHDSRAAQLIFNLQTGVKREM